MSIQKDRAKQVAQPTNSQYLPKILLFPPNSLGKLKASQVDLRRTVFGIRKALQQPADQQLNWKTLAIAGLGMACLSAVASGATVCFVASTLQNNDSNALTEKAPEKNNSEKSKKTQLSR